MHDTICTFSCMTTCTFRERDMLRALAAQERQATRQRQRTTDGPKDDEDIEWEQLMEAHHQAG